MTSAALAAPDAGWQVDVPQVKVHENLALGEVKQPHGKINQQQQQSPEKISEASEPLAIDILDRLEKSLVLQKDEKTLLAAHLLEGIDEMHLQPGHREILREAAILKSLLKDNSTSLDENNEGGWIRQGKHTGRHNFSIDYKLTGQELSCRLETIIHSDFLVPILSVLNESELYAAWLPNYNVPRVKVLRSEKLHQIGRCSQVVNVETEIPWPLAAREVILKAVACDNIDSYDEVENGSVSNCLGQDGGRIIISLQSLDSEDNGVQGLDIPPAKKGVVRVKVEGGFTIEKCPTDHVMMESSMQYDAKSSDNAGAPTSDDLVLVTFTFCADPQLALVPKSLINFFTRTAMGQMWNMFLNVAEEVKEGKRPAHLEAIEKKPELYEWIKERTRVMLGQSPSSS